MFFTFHFSLLFPVLFPRCASLLYSPLHYLVVGSKSSSQSLKKWWLRTCAHLRKKVFHKNLWFPIFSFNLYTDSILKQLNKLKNINIYFSLFIFLCCFPFCFPVVLPYCIPRCTTSSLGRSPRANRWKNDDLGLVPIFKKKYHKNLWFSIFSFDWYTNSILKQLNKLKNINMFFSLFIFLCCFPFCFPVVLPYCSPCCTTPSLGRSPRANRWKNDDLGLVPIFKNIFHKNLWFSIFPFDLYTDSILKQLNKLKNINMFFFTFHFSLLFPVLFPRCASLLYSPLRYPVVGSKSSSHSLKKWWLRTCAHLQKEIFHKNLWFRIFPSISIQIVF